VPRGGSRSDERGLMRVLSKAGSSDLADLLRRVAAKDRAAFADLYAATSAKLLGVILRILQRRGISEEVLQEVYVKVWERAADYNPAKGSPIGWLATIARNRALDEVRRKAPQSIEDTPEALDVMSDTLDQLSRMEQSEDLQKLVACLDKLEGKRREMVVLAYCHGLSRDDLSQRFSAPVATIKTWLHRSLAQLRTCLSQ
jgi:RNA polymerase sigma-70 factor (ECF subfamily)